MVRISRYLLIGLAIAGLVGVAAAETGTEGVVKGSARLGAVEKPQEPGARAKILQTVTAQGVALNPSADCSSNADIDITLTTVGALREYGLTTAADGTVLGEFEQSTGLPDFSGTYVGYGQPIFIPQPAGTVIGSYAYVGDTPPNASNTGEFFVAYVCDTLEVLDTCYGPYGSCPQTAQEWQEGIERPIPVVSRTGIVLLVVLLAVAGAAVLVLRRVL